MHNLCTVRGGGATYRTPNPQRIASRRNGATSWIAFSPAGDSCGDCGNFTLVRNGTCMKCDTCGATSGCS